jgi:DNA primase
MDEQKDISIFQKINEKTDILQLVSPYVPDLKKSGKNYMGCCPFHHENTPSFSVSVEKNICKCMSCKKGGNPITFYSQINNVSISEAASVLASKVGIQYNSRNTTAANPNIPLLTLALQLFVYNLKNNDENGLAKDYLNKRGLEESTIEFFKIGLAPKLNDALFQILIKNGFNNDQAIDSRLVTKTTNGYRDFFQNRITIPIFTSHIVGFGGRSLDNKNNPKYLNSPESDIFKKDHILFNFNNASSSITAGDFNSLILVEGFFDVIKLHQAGFRNVIATMGTNLSVYHLKQIKSVTKELTLMYDGDKPGQDAMFNNITKIFEDELTINVVILPDKLDPDEYVEKFGRKELKNLLEFSKMSRYDFIVDYGSKNNNFKNPDEISVFFSSIRPYLSKCDSNVINYISNLAKKKYNYTLKVDNLKQSPYHQQQPQHSNYPQQSQSNYSQQSHSNYPQVDQSRDYDYLSQNNQPLPEREIPTYDTAVSKLFAELLIFSIFYPQFGTFVTFTESETIESKYKDINLDGLDDFVYPTQIQIFKIFWDKYKVPDQISFKEFKESVVNYFEQEVKDCDRYFVYLESELFFDSANIQSMCKTKNKETMHKNLMQTLYNLEIQINKAKNLRQAVTITDKYDESTAKTMEIIKKRNERNQWLEQKIKNLNNK